MTNLTLEERQRLAYANGDTTTATLLAEAAELQYANEDLAWENDRLKEQVEILENPE